MDAVTKKKQQSWLDFKTGKGAKKKVCGLPLHFSCGLACRACSLRLLTVHACVLRRRGFYQQRRRAASSACRMGLPARWAWWAQARA